MGKSIGTPRRHMREKAEDTLFPAVCAMRTIAEQVNQYGEHGEQLGPKLKYRGSEDIPCRFDISAHFREIKIYEQEVTANEYVFHVPHDAPLNANVTIIHQGRQFEVIKTYDVESYAVSRSGLVSELQFGSQNRNLVAQAIQTNMDGLEVTFISDVIFGALPYTYAWDFGDGSTQVDSSNPSEITHTYAQAGKYTVRMAVTDDVGTTRILRQAIEVFDA